MNQNGGSDKFLSARLPKTKAEVSLIECGTDALILDENEERVITLNRSARFIFERCDGNHTVGELIEEMMTQFIGGTQARLEADVTDALKSFSEKGILEDSRILE